MTILLPTWRPKKRQVYYGDCPDWIPKTIYNEAVMAKRYYNENWEHWIWLTAQDHNCSIPIAEDACIRGIKREILQIQIVYGEQIGKWFEEYLDMKDIFSKVNHPTYTPKLG